MRKKIEIVVITECRLIQIGIESMLSTETDINLLATVTTAQVLSSEHEPEALLYQKPALEVSPYCEHTVQRLTYSS